MHDVPSIAVFCSESTECFPGTASKLFLKSFITILVAPIITGIIIHFMFHIHHISIHKPLYFSFFVASFCMKFLSMDIATSNNMHVFSFLFLICHIFMFTYWFVCVYNFLSCWCLVLCILIKVNVLKLYHISFSTHSSPKWVILRFGEQEFLDV